MSETPKISVVICAYTELRWNELINAVESVKSQTVPPHEIIVAIDHNPDLLARAREHITGITLVENAETRGLSGARNSGIAATSGDIIAFMDEDAVAAADWLEQLSKHYQNPDVVGAGGSIQPLWLAGRPGWFPTEFDWVVGCTYRGMPETATTIRNMIGCNMSFRSKVFDEVGGFRSGIGRVGTLPVGCEETELCIRINQHWPESQLIFEPAARVEHIVPATRSNWHYFWTRCYSEGISKALVSQFVGAQDGLSSERTYTFRTLPIGVLRGLRDTLRLDFAGLGRASAIVAGLFITTFGYLKGRIAQRNQPAATTPQLRQAPQE